MLPDAVDDEVSQITMGQANQGQKADNKIDFGLPARGAFSDPHDSQRQDDFGDRKASISTQDDFAVPDVLKKTLIGQKDTSSFEPTTTHSESSAPNVGDQSTVKTVTKEQA